MMTVLLSIIALAMALAACGKVKKADEQPNGQLAQPPFTADPAQPFQLTAEKPIGNFRASLIFWAPKPTPEQIRAISEASNKGRQNKSATLTYVEQELVPAIKAHEAAKQVSAAVNGRSQGDIRSAFQNPETKRTQSQPKANVWFKARLDDAAATDPHVQANRTQTETMWKAYCETKLAELATSSMAVLRYVERPTPLQFCEPYFAEKTYFDHASCAAAPDASGQVYFNCLWEAVLKTELFKTQLSGQTCGDGSPVKGLAAVKGWLESGVLLRLISDGAKREKVRTTIMSGSVFDPDFDADTKTCRLGFKRKPPVNNADFTKEFPSKLKAIAEFQGAPDQKFRLFTRHVPADASAEAAAAAEAADAQLNVLVTDKIKRFAERLVSGNFEVSVNELVFNHPLDGDLVLSDETIKAFNTIIPADPAAADAAFRPFAEIRAAAEAPLNAEKAQRQQEETAARAIFVEKDEGRQAKIQEVKYVTIEGVSAVNAPGATRYLQSYDVQVEQSEGRLEIGIEFKKGGMLVGCVDLASGESCAVDSEKLENARALKSASIDKASNKLTIEVALEDLETIGFASSPRAAEGQLVEAFNDFPESELLGRTLKVEMYANLLNGNLDFFTGNAWIMDGDRKAYSGSVSGDGFAEKLSRLVNAAKPAELAGQSGSAHP